MLRGARSPARSTSSAPSAARRTSSGRWTCDGPALDRAVAADHGHGSRPRRGSRRPDSTTSPRSDHYWSNANVNENFPAADHAAPLLDRPNGLLPLLPQSRRARSASRARRVAAMEEPLRPHHRRPRRADVLQPHEHSRRPALGAVRRSPRRVVQPVRRRRKTPTRRRRADAKQRARRGEQPLARRAGRRARGHRGEDDLAVPVRDPSAWSDSNGRSTAFADRTHPDGCSRRGVAATLLGRLPRRSSTFATIAGSTRRSPTPRRWSATARCSAGSAARSRRRSGRAPQQPAQGPARSAERHAGAEALGSLAPRARRPPAARPPRQPLPPRMRSPPSGAIPRSSRSRASSTDSSTTGASAARAS